MCVLLTEVLRATVAPRRERTDPHQVLCLATKMKWQKSVTAGSEEEETLYIRSSMEEEEEEEEDKTFLKRVVGSRIYPPAPPAK